MKPMSILRRLARRPTLASAALAPALAAVLAVLPLPALAELMLYPTRVVFIKNQRAAQVELINNSAEPATYRISVVNRRMSEAGDFLNVTEAGPGELFADSMLIWSPRQITLQPGTAQVVRLMVRKSDPLPEGEYRSHLHLEKLAPAAKLASSAEPDRKAETRIGVVFKTLVGASIPVIVRHGATHATVALSQLALASHEHANGGKGRVLAFAIERAGNSSVYGDVSVSFTPRGAAELQLAKASGVAVYTPNPLRRAALALQLPPGIALANGQLRLVYRERPENGGKLLAEATLALP